MSTNVKKKTDFYWLHIFIMLAFMLGFGFLPPLEPITPIGMKVLGVFIGMLYGWTTIGMAMPCLLGIILAGFFGIMANCKAVFIAAFGNDSFIFIVFVLIFVGMLDELKVVDYIANWLMTRRFLSGKPWVFSYMLLLGALIMGMVAQPFPAIFFFWNVTYKVCDVYGYKQKEPWPAFMILGVCIGAIFSMVTCPWRAFVVVLMGTFSTLSNGATVDMFSHFIYLMPISLLLLAVYLCVGKFVFRIDVEKIKNIDVDRIIADTPVATKEQKVGLIALSLFLVAVFIPAFLPAEWKLTMILNNLGTTGICILTVAILLIVRINGKTVLDFQSAASKGMSWEIFAMAFCLITFVGFLTNGATGISAFLNMYLGNALSGIHGYALMFVLVALAAILTNIANNGVVGIIIMTLGFMLAPTGGIENTTLMSMMVMYGATLGFLTPAATPYSAVAFGNKEWIEAKQIYKYGGVAFIIFIIIYGTLGYLWGNIIF